MFWEGKLARAAALLATAPRNEATRELHALALVLDGRPDDARALAPRGLARGFLALHDADLTAAVATFSRFVDRTALGRLARFGLAAVAYRTGDHVEVQRQLAPIITAGGDLFVTRWARAQWQGTPPARQRRGPSLAVVTAFVLAFVGMAVVSERRTVVVRDPAPGPTLEEATARLAPQRNGISELYFVAVAGYGAQDVFHNEVLGAERVMVDRFDATDRTLVLTNDPRGEGFYPPASKRSLERALAAVGARMNVEEDILFLFLTSHGSSRGLVLASSFASYDDDDANERLLRPEELVNMLDAAAIRWRVVVVAGCETGVFVGPLANESTLVVTAAASDRSSYGCANGRTNTEFGRAIFVEQLETQRSFSDAFGAATRQIGLAEAKAGLLPSRPQIAEGAAIGPKLRAFEGQLGRPRFPWFSR